MECPERQKLAATVDQTLERVITLTKQERAAMNESKSVFCVLDRELELAVGEKERSNRGDAAA